MIYHAAVQAIPAVCSTAAATKTSSSILDPIAKPIADVLAFFYSLIPNYAVAILLLSLVWMVIISPLTLKTTRSMLAMQKLSPELKRLQEKHRNDRQALAQAQMDLYKTHNVSPFGSCLPTILPLPVFIALFRVIDGLSATTKIDGVSCATPHFLSHNTAMYHAIRVAGGHLNAFGLDLAKSALSSHSSVAAAIPFFILLLIMMGTQYLQTAQMMSRNQAAQQNSQMAMMKYLPLVFGLICIRFPAGVVLYYAMSNVCRIVQQDLMYRFDPKVKALAIKDVIEIEASAGVTDDGEASGLFNRRRGDGDGDGATEGTSGRTRFRDLLGGELQKQAEVREQTRAQKALPKGGASGGAAGKSGGGSTKSGSRSGPAKAGSGPARPGSGSGPAKAGAGASRSGSGRPSGSGNAGRKTTASRQNPATGTGRTGSARPGKPAPTKATEPTRSTTGNGAAESGESAAAPAGRGSTGSDGGATETPVNGQRSGSPTPDSGGDSRETPTRTGSGSGRTGAGSGRTGAQGSRNRRRGR